MNDLIKEIDWQKVNDLIPAVIQDANTSQILMLGYMDSVALARTLKTKKIWFFSRSKNRLWMKGETSNDILKLKNIALDCDNDTLLIQAEPQGPTCHTSNISCFANSQENIFNELYEVINSRKQESPKTSYTSFLMNKGLKKICAKIAEESKEVIKAANQETDKRLIEESVDVLYHLFVLLNYKDLKIQDLIKEIRKRRK
ncbi:MAG: bifunctional phosphoribosyl-AMP cyclohydrolase/phosphoribosyl-ATP diphosphatase HisIE [Patescibacteria group bacterium]